MIINIREEIKKFDDKTLELLDTDLNKKPVILSDNLFGVYCGEKYNSQEVKEVVIEFNMRLVNSNLLRLPRKDEINTKGKTFWFEEDPESDEIKGLFLVMNKKEE
jgi:hypothetical protein